MKNIKKLEWLGLTDSSLSVCDFIHYKYRKCDFYREYRNSSFFWFLNKRENNKNKRIIDIFNII